MFLDWELDGFSFSIYYSQLDAQIRADASPGKCIPEMDSNTCGGKDSAKYF